MFKVHLVLAGGILPARLTPFDCALASAGVTIPANVTVDHDMHTSYPGGNFTMQQQGFTADVKCSPFDPQDRSLNYTKQTGNIGGSLVNQKYTFHQYQRSCRNGMSRIGGMDNKFQALQVLSCRHIAAVVTPLQENFTVVAVPCVEFDGDNAEYCSFRFLPISTPHLSVSSSADLCRNSERHLTLRCRRYSTLQDRTANDYTYGRLQ